MGLIDTADVAELVPLTGGVSSDIRLVHIRTGAEERVLVFKRALTTLRVEAQWHAPIRRGAAEAEWLRYAASVVPDGIPRVIGTDAETFAIALEFLPRETYANWKTRLLSGAVDADFAAAVGRLIGRIHSASAAEPALAQRFGNQDMFESLRIEPYLRRTAEAVPEVAAEINGIVALLEAPGRALVHGDLSPKNILIGPASPVILDAECATWSDPAFDVAFCLTHLVLKSVHLPDHAQAFRTAAISLRAAYLAEVDWEAGQEINDRIDRILPGLLLARVAGASPAEYLDDHARAAVRRLAIRALRGEHDLLPAPQNSQKENEPHV